MVAKLFWMIWSRRIQSFILQPSGDRPCADRSWCFCPSVLVSRTSSRPRGWMIFTWQNSPKPILRCILRIYIILFQYPCPILFVWSLQIYSLTHPPLKPKPGGFACIEAHRFGIGICFCGAPCLPQSPNHAYCNDESVLFHHESKHVHYGYSICVYLIYVNLYINNHS